MFTLKEIERIVISVLVLGLVFGFNDHASTFVIDNWIKNFILVGVFVAISLIMNQLVVKYFAYRHDCSEEFRIWHLQRFGFKRWEKIDKGPTGKAIHGLPLGMILAFLLAILTNGIIYFAAVWDNLIVAHKTARTGRKHQTLGDYEEALIQLSGPMTNVALMVLGVALGSLLKVNLTVFVNINFFMAIFQMMPFSTLPGCKIFFGSRNLFVFSILLIILAFLLKSLGLIGAIVIAVLLAGLLTGAYYWLWEK